MRLTQEITLTMANGLTSLKSLPTTFLVSVLLCRPVNFTRLHARDVNDAHLLFVARLLWEFLGTIFLFNDIWLLTPGPVIKLPFIVERKANLPLQTENYCSSPLHSSVREDYRRYRFL